MEFLFNDSALSRLGKVYLRLRFRKKEQAQRELQAKYEGKYRNAGIVLLADLFMAFAVVAFVALIAAVLYFVAS